MAMAILVIGIVGVVRIMPTGLKASKSSQMSSQAAFLAQKTMEELKLAGFTALVAGAVPLSGDEGDYLWEAEVTEVSLEGLASSGNIRKLGLTVSWEEKARSHSQQFITYISR